MQADVRDVVPAAAVVDVAHVGEVRGALERRPGERGASRRRAGRRTRRRCGGGGSSRASVASRSKYSTARAPQPVTSRASCSSTAAVPLRAPVRDRVGDEAALAERRALDRQQPAHAEQVADVRHDPLLAGLDEPVVVEPLDVGLEDAQLLLDDRQQRAQLVAALVRVAVAVDRGQQPVQVVARRRSWRALRDRDAGRVDQQQLGRLDLGPATARRRTSRTCSSWRRRLRAATSSSAASSVQRAAGRWRRRRAPPATTSTTSAAVTGWPNERRSNENAAAAAPRTASRTSSTRYAGSTRTAASRSK